MCSKTKNVRYEQSSSEHSLKTKYFSCPWAKFAYAFPFLNVENTAVNITTRTIETPTYSTTRVTLKLYCMIIPYIIHTAYCDNSQDEKNEDNTILWKDVYVVFMYLIKAFCFPHT